MKKFLTLLFAALLSVTTLFGYACGKAKIPVGEPDYSADEGTLKVRFGGWCAPPPMGSFANQTESYITPEQYGYVAEAGLDFINGLNEKGNSPDVKLALDCAAGAGIKYLVYWPAILNYANADVKSLRNAISEIISHEACMGIFACDEPNASTIKKLGKVSQLYRQITDKQFYVNLFPIYANPEQLGVSTGYRDYIKYYCDNVKGTMISEDNYPFSDNGLSYGVGADFLLNLEIIQRNAVKYGLEHWEFIQAISNGAGTKLCDYNDYSMQIYTSMAFGAQTLQYFCYFQPLGDAADYDEDLMALVAPDGKRTKYWYDAKKINAEIHSFDHVFMNFVNRWQGVLPVVGTNNEKGKLSAFNMMDAPLKSYSRIKSVTASEDTVIGCFKDKNNYDGFMVVNYSVPGDKKTDNVTLEFKEAQQAVCYNHGVYSLVDLTDGKLELSLEAGQGAFVIPVKNEVKK